ncbi:hypothetical protein [Moorella sp. Hama-1]|uniref:hypothetical protein n=1 Tax=Moorella sp. Hama-1 TaxID=2138101 RepID=UPI000D647080|nr:hypothetical protein [Moorella sp. Hama-1]MDN5361788.1 hypothetical protein [Moorella sp. (in: firmicutes)]BCV21963.1 hypothetical protein hamaS1_20320 [Moorella sp. Hama-1]
MAKVLAEVDYTGVLPVLTATELNEAYARLDERYNCLRSNWDWFRRADYTPVAADPAGRVDQN